MHPESWNILENIYAWLVDSLAATGYKIEQPYCAPLRVWTKKLCREQGIKIQFVWLKVQVSVNVIKRKQFIIYKSASIENAIIKLQNLFIFIVNTVNCSLTFRTNYVFWSAL